MGRGSETGDRSPNSGSEAGADPVRAESPDAGDAGRYAWWDWSEAVSDLDPPLRRVAEALARRVEDPPGGGASSGGEDPDDGGDRITPELVSGTGVPLEELWGAVARLHRSLDGCRGSVPGEELREARRRLDEAAGELWSAGVEAEVASVRDFLGEVAHDFRSPLHSSLFLTDTLFREQAGSLSRAQKRQLSVVHSAVAALLRMSNDLLDLSDSDEQGVMPDGVEEVPFSPRQVVEDLEDLLEPITFHRDAELETEVDDVPYRVGDPQVLNRVLLNLASNSLEAVEDGGTVRIRVEGDGERLRAAVEDDSGDADPEQLRSLLEGCDYACVVRRLGGQTRGLGLVISGRMVRAAGGELSVQRTDEGWTRLSLILPFPVLEGEEPAGVPDQIS